MPVNEWLEGSHSHVTLGNPRNLGPGVVYWVTVGVEGRWSKALNQHSHKFTYIVTIINTLFIHAALGVSDPVHQSAFTYIYLQSARSFKVLLLLDDLASTRRRSFVNSWSRVVVVTNSHKPLARMSSQFFPPSYHLLLFISQQTSSLSGHRRLRRGSFLSFSPIFNSLCLSVNASNSSVIVVPPVDHVPNVIL